MTRTCAYPGCGDAFEAKRTDARFCSDTCRAKASKDRARGQRAERAKGRTDRRPVGPAASQAGGHVADEVAARLAAMEQRLAATEAGVTRAEADRAGWKKVRDQLQAALARVGDSSGAVSAEKIAAAVRAEVGPQLARLGKRLDAVEAAQAAVRTELGRLPLPPSGPTAEDQMTLAKAVGKLNTRMSSIERDLRAFNKGVVEAVDEVE
jgi:hypothetical protein